jgi:hypothetical protein
MQISKIVTDGSARDEALKRRNNAMREALGMQPAPSRNASEPQEAKTEDEREAYRGGLAAVSPTQTKARRAWRRCAGRDGPNCLD